MKKSVETWQSVTKVKNFLQSWRIYRRLLGY